MSKKLMILGAGRGQIGLIKASKKLGYITIVASIEGNYPGFKYADEVCYVDISKPEAVYEMAKKNNIDGIATACLDTGIASIGYVCDKLNLCGLNAKAAKISNNKLLMKKAFEDNGVSTARFREIWNEKDVYKACRSLEFPLIIKAVDLQGSKGIYICNNEEEVKNSYSKVMSESKQDYCIIEEFIEGEEFGAQALVLDNEIVFVLPTSDETFRGNTNIPVGHAVPFNCPKAEYDIICKQVQQAIYAIELNNCAVNVDLIKKGDKYYVIELTGRAGANCLPELTSIYYDIPFYEIIALLAIGEKERVREIFSCADKPQTAAIAKMLFVDKDGMIKDIKCNKEKENYVYDITFFVEEKSDVRKFENSRDCIGQAIVTGEDIIDCNEKMEELISSISYTIE